VRTLNLGILAHVDAGKTSLTERLLHTVGAIDDLGSVDAGTTRTDTLELERRRGITIKSAVVSFSLSDVTVNLIDTPGHPDFIAEVERVLGVLDGAVLVLSAVEGVQAQTRTLMRVLRRLRIPTLLFVNKIDRTGARDADLLGEIADRLTPAVARMSTVSALGGPEAAVRPWQLSEPAHARQLLEVLAEQDDGLLAAYVGDRIVPDGELWAALRDQTRRSLVHPVYFGSAMTGAGIPGLIDGITSLLPVERDPEAPVDGTVFKVERGPAGEKIAYLSLAAGTVRVRDRVALGPDRAGTVTSIGMFGDATVTPSRSVTAGRIARITGWKQVRVGDTIGRAPADAAEAHHFAPPTLAAVVQPRRAGDRGALFAALTQLAEQDPLIQLRHDPTGQDIAVSLYGEVQKEVIETTLAAEYGIDVEFAETTTLFIERPAGVATAVARMGDVDNPFRATIGLRVAPAPVGSGVQFRLGIELGSLPLSFIKAVEQTARRTLQQGVSGWQVTDCQITLTDSGYTPPPPYGWSKWSSSAGDFRSLTPLVLREALRRAGTTVWEPIHRFDVEAPADTLPAILNAVAGLGGTPLTTLTTGRAAELNGQLPAANIHRLRRLLPGLSRGEGLFNSVFDHYRQVRDPIPRRPRTDHDPLDRKAYLSHLAPQA
jgi:ribosomal protection tetracycline resistance protein